MLAAIHRIDVRKTIVITVTTESLTNALYWPIILSLQELIPGNLINTISRLLFGFARLKEVAR